MAEKILASLSNNDSMVDLMAERRSIRIFDKSKIIPTEILNKILETMRLAPASYGLFNVRILVLPQSKFRDQMNDIFHQQKNFITASHFIIFLVDSGDWIRSHTIFETSDAIFGKEASPQKNSYIENFQNVYESRFWNREEAANAWSEHQAYIAGGVATVTAAAYDVGTCMIGGFDTIKLNSFLREKGLISKHQLAVLGLALGYPDLSYKFKPKARLNFDDYVMTVAE